MKSFIWLLRRGLAVLAATTTIGVLAVTPAHAATFVVCDSYPAPSISASGGYFTAHYSHVCNTIVGVTRMAGFITILRDDGDGNRANDVVVKYRQVVAAPQGTAAGTTQWPVGSQHGRYYAWELLLFNGDITSGPAPHGGCGRNADGDLECNWYTAPVFG
jgi:hypothetical protein